MSISSALSSAVSGLTTTSRSADVISSNLANALTPGYARRQLELETLGYGIPGVAVTGITRLVDQGIIADRQNAGSELAYADTRAGFLAQIERVIGTPDDPASLSGRLAAFEAGLVTASASPDNPANLQNAVFRAEELANSLNTAASEIERRRTEAEGQIARAVDSVNTLLGQIRDVNIQIARHGPADHHAATLLDQRQALVDQMSEFIPVRQVPRDNGTIALFTPGGAILLDGTAATLEFNQSNLVAPHMTLSNGLLSGLSINGVDVQPAGSRSPIDGGRLAALFSVRDDLGVDMQTQLDAVTRDIIERFQQADLDPTRAPGDPGLFTDAGAAFDPLNEIGVAGRISLNTAVDPDQGGETWRLRDGLGAVTQGPAGNGTLLSQLASVLGASQALSSGDLGGGARSSSGHFATLTSRLAQDRLTLDQSLSFATVRQSELAELELQNGVDSDAELQRLLLVERAYSANARMIQTIDDMMQTLLRI
ncbi:flagellar hook-associated protein FlgK [Roseovarius sp. 2305UL8-3]|uniref:flagellar hook-associated protein FlgK n=1 Tax=Roseovarius conchicola TaxID=3121636 RepID=UPI0035278CAC